MYGIIRIEVKFLVLFLSCGFFVKLYGVLFICKDVGISEWSNLYSLIYVRYCLWCELELLEIWKGL